MSAAAGPEAVAAKLREMGMAPADAARVARGELGLGRPTLPLEHRAAISDTKRTSNRKFVRREETEPAKVAPPAPVRVIAEPAPPRVPLCPGLGIVAAPGLGGVSVARVAFLDGASA